MYWLIEDENKIDIICNAKYEDVFVEIIPTSQELHPSENSISLIYFRPINNHKGYIIPINHNDTLNLDLNEIKRVINSFKNIYVRDAKNFLHYFIRKHVYQPTPSPNPYILKSTKCHEFYNKSTYKHKYLNTIIPVVKHYEACEDAFYNYDINNINKFYSQKAAVVYNLIERSPIKVDTELYEKYFDKSDVQYVYTNYDFNSLTTRPSNTFGNINFSSLNKTNNEREAFIPKNDVFIELDISAYHPTLLSHIIGYSFGDNDIHAYFSSLYGVDYNKAKELTFKQIYGGVFEQYKDLDFFKAVTQYTNQQWDLFNTQGYIISPISGYKFEKGKLQDMNPQKLLNYILQEKETSTNILILWDIFNILKKLNTSIVLTVYDSFLLDLDINEKNILIDIENIFNKYNLKIKYKKGYNYNFE